MHAHQRMHVRVQVLGSWGSGLNRFNSNSHYASTSAMTSDGWSTNCGELNFQQYGCGVGASMSYWTGGPTICHLRKALPSGSSSMSVVVAFADYYDHGPNGVSVTVTDGDGSVLGANRCVSCYPCAVVVLSLCCRRAIPVLSAYYSRALGEPC